MTTQNKRKWSVTKGQSYQSLNGPLTRHTETVGVATLFEDDGWIRASEYVLFGKVRKSPKILFMMMACLANPYPITTSIK